MPMKTWPSWLFGSTRRRDPPHLAVEIAGAEDLELRRLLGLQLGDVAGRHHADQIVLALGDDREQRVLARCRAAYDRRRRRDRARHRRRDVDRVGAVGQLRQHLAGGDGVAGIGHHLRHLQAETVGPDLLLVAWQHDAGDLDDIAEAELCGLQHRHRRALRHSVGLARGKRGRGREHEQRGGGEG
ncbi:hypothetical protein ABIF38_001417 [Bradyrhizobium japonicum]